MKKEYTELKIGYIWKQNTQKKDGIHIKKIEYIEIEIEYLEIKREYLEIHIEYTELKMEYI